MISEDWEFMTNYENFKILNVEAFLYLFEDNERLNSGAGGFFRGCPLHSPNQI